MINIRFCFINFKGQLFNKFFEGNVSTFEYHSNYSTKPYNVDDFITWTKEFIFPHVQEHMKNEWIMKIMDILSFRNFKGLLIKRIFRRHCRNIYALMSSKEIIILRLFRRLELLNKKIEKQSVFNWFVIIPYNSWNFMGNIFKTM